jgi:hypothetical protein
MAIREAVTELRLSREGSTRRVVVAARATAVPPGAAVATYGRQASQLNVVLVPPGGGSAIAGDSDCG